jgi:hypothetical protein
MKIYRAQKGEIFMTRNRAANNLRGFGSRLRVVRPITLGDDRQQGKACYRN